MFKKSITLACLILVGATAVIKGDNPQKFSADKVVAVVGNSEILYSDLKERSNQILTERRESGYTSDRDVMNEALESMLLQKLLYNQALIDSVGVKGGSDDIISRQVDAYVEAMVADAGSLVALEKREGMPIFDIRENLRQKVEESQFAQMMQSDVMSKVSVTPGEVERFYRDFDKATTPIVPEQYVYARITKLPTNTTAAKQRARERLMEMRERIINGTRFDLLARMYSQDPGTARTGGEMSPSRLEGFVAPFADALSKLQPGQVSEVVETEYGFHIIELMEKKDNLYRMRHILLAPEFTDEELLECDILLDSLVTQIRQGTITFEEAALKYSDDKYTKQNGGVMTNNEYMDVFGIDNNRNSELRSIFYREELMDDYPAIRGMKVGDVSSSFRGKDLRGNVMSKIVKLLQVIPSHAANLKDDYIEIERLALYDKQNKEFEKWLEQKISSMYVRIDPEFRNGEFVNKNWVK